MPGDRIGRYEIRGTLGIGGSGVVARAYDELLDADVAIKVLSETGNAHAGLRERFVREAQLLRRVRSHDLITVHDIGELDDGRPYFVMEYANGGVLSQRLDTNGPLDDAGLRILVDVLGRGLEALHHAGIVHRDVKPGNILIIDERATDTSGNTRIRSSSFEPSERLVIGDLGFAKDVQATQVGPTVVGGTPGYMAPEQRQVGGDISPVTDIYAATGVLWSALTAQFPPEAEQLAAQLASVPSRWQALLERGLDPEPSRRYQSAREWADAVRRCLGDHPDADSTGPSSRTSFAVAEAGAICPYKGLASYQPDDAHLYFGRSELVEQLVARLQATPMLVVGGPSGSGKSSLVRAGLIPQLTRGVIAGSQNWTTLLFTPGPEALDELAFQLGRIDPDRPAPSPASLRDDPRQARRFVGPDQPVLLAIDQFEELFTLNHEKADQEAFLAVLEAMTESTHSAVKIVLALRADFYGACARHPWLAARINANQVLVGPMGRKNLLEAIEGPASRVGMRLEPGLAEQVVDDAGTDPGSLPLVAHAMMETWLRRAGNLLTFDGYEQAGGVSGAIAQSAEATYQALTAERRDAVRRLILRLTTPGEGSPDTRRRVPLSQIEHDPASVEVVDVLADARLLTVGNDTVEIAHEALLRSWPRLAGWIDESRDDLRTRQRITAAAIDWDRNERETDLLYHGAPLAAAIAWYEPNRAELGQPGSDFLDSAIDQSQLEQAATEAAEAQRRRIRRRAVTALASLAIAAVIATFVALISLRQSRQNEETAQDALGRSLAAASVGSAETDPAFGIALAAEAMARSNPPTAAARDAMVVNRAALASRNPLQPQPLGSTISVGEADTVTISPDGLHVAVGDKSGTVTVYRSVDRSRLFAAPAHSEGVEEAAFDPTSRFLATTGGDGLINLFDLQGTDPASPTVIAEVDSALWSVAFTTDSREVIAAAEDGWVRAFAIDVDVPPREIHAAVIADSRDYLSVDVRPDGSGVAIGDGTGHVTLVSMAGGDAAELTAHERGFDVWELVFDPDGSRLVSVAASGDVAVWSASDASLLARIASTEEAPFGPAQGVTLMANGDVLIGGGDGHLYRFDGRDYGFVTRSAAGHNDQIVDTAIADDGRIAVTLADDQTVRLWDTGGERPPMLTSLASDLPTIGDIGVSADGTTIVTIGTDEPPTLSINRDSTTLTVALDHAPTAVGVTAEHIIVGDDAGGLQRYRLDDGTPVGERIAPHDRRILHIAVSADQSTVATTGSDGTVRTWRSDLTSIANVGQHANEAWQAVFTADGDRLVSVGLDEQVRFWNVNGGESRSSLSINEPKRVAISPDGGAIAVGSDNGVVTVIELDNPESAVTLTGLDKRVVDVVFAPSGIDIITTDLSGTVRYWDRFTGARLGGAIRPFTTLEPAPAYLASDAAGHAYVGGAGGTVLGLSALDVETACRLAKRQFDPAREAAFLGEMDGRQSCLDD